MAPLPLAVAQEVADSPWYASWLERIAQRRELDNAYYTANVEGIDSAVKWQWIDPKTGALTGTSFIDNIYAVKIPKGTTVYDGPVGYQGGIYLGGPYTNQVFVPTPWKIPGVQEVWSRSIK